MYAIETKKRKFDRILDSIRDPKDSQSKVTLSAGVSGTSTISLVASETTKERATKRLATLVHNSPHNVSSSSLASHHTANYLPSNREAFLERLKTFRPITKWHIPSIEAINAATWANRGWRCVDTDMVACGSCKEQLFVKIKDDAEEETNSESNGKEEDDFDVKLEVHAGIVARYLELVIVAHTDHCPWRRRGCDGSIQRISGLLNTPSSLSALHERYSSIKSLANAIPLPKVHLEASPPFSVNLDLQHLKLESFDAQIDTDALYLAVCGWQKSEERGDDVVECQHCFRALGLWLYRGENPAMEKLDAIESHLEYCPWRSSDAQHTEIKIDGKRHLVPGWWLLANTLRKGSTQKLDSKTTAPSSDAHVAEGSTMDERPQEQDKEHKMKDLLRRVKELKKPFNVKALLKKKPPS